MDRVGFAHGEMEDSMDKTRHANPQASRLTIGLLMDWLEGGYQSAIWSGVSSVCRERDVNLLCFIGGPLRSPYGFDAQRNVVYELTDMQNVHGLVIAMGTLANFIDLEEARRFCERYHPLPMTSIALSLEGIPDIAVDNAKGTREAVSHLVEVHGRRRIAFIRGPDGAHDADQRYRAYIDALAEHSLPFDPDLVAPGDFLYATGSAAIHLLLDERKVSFDGVMAANDDMALGALEALQARGIQVPHDVALIGFDDTETARFAQPPMTTVRQPIYRLGRQAVEMVLAQLKGQEVPEHVTVPSELVNRASCGCMDPTVARASAGLKTYSPAGTTTRETLEVTLAAQREHIVAEMTQALQAPSLEQEQVSHWARQLLDALTAELERESPGILLQTLGEILQQVRASEGSISAWHRAVSVLRRRILESLADRAIAPWIEDLWQQAQVLIGRTSEQVQAYRRLRTQEQSAALRSISQVLGTMFDVEELTDAAAQLLPQLGVERCYVSLYEQSEGGNVPAEWSNLILAYDATGRVDLEPSDRRFPSRQLVPDRVLQREKRYTMLVEALYFRDEQIGFALFEARRRGENVHEVLRGQLSSALKWALLFQEHERAERQLQRYAAELEKQRRHLDRATETVEERTRDLAHRTRYLEATAEIAQDATAVLDPQELISGAVTLISERLGFYHVGIFLLDRSNKWAVLQAASSESGRRLLESGNRLRVGHESIVGHVITQGEPYVALDRDPKTALHDDPDLPSTRSQLTLPLRARNRVIGALDVQSTKPKAFSDVDTAVLQTLADQIAVAIDNARLYEQARYEISERMRAEEEAQRRAAQAALIYEVGQRVSGKLELEALLSEIVTAVQEAFRYYGVLLLLDEERTCLTLQAVAGAYADCFPEGLEIPIDTGMTGHAAATGETQLSGDVSQNPYYVRHAEEQTQSELAVPIESGGRVIGVLDLQSDRLDAFDETDVMLMETLADQLAVVLENALLYEAMQQELAERKRAEQALQQEKELLDALMNSGTDSIYFKDRQSRLTRVNRKMMQDFNIDDESDIVGKTDLDLLGEELGKKTMADERHIMATGEPLTDVVEQWKRPDGRVLWTSTTKVPMRDAEGRITGIIGITREVTKRMQAEERLRRYAAELERSNEEVKRFAYIVSHDLRAPLVNLKGFAAELRMTFGEIQPVVNTALPHLTEEQRRTITHALREDIPESLKFIDSSVEHMDSFISALLKLSRLGRRELKLELVDMNGIVDGILSTLAHQIAEHKGTVRVEQLPQVVADRTSMEQVMANILGNAVKYLTTERPAEIVVSGERLDDETMFHIRDNGRGIAQQDMDKVFTPFRRAGRQDVPGEGMGLAYVQALVRRHGGRIWCESELGVGTTLAFTIPNRLEQGSSLA
jgi:sigma-B regulation protein RsbU (phosphoserine phosphatase)